MSSESGGNGDGPPSRRRGLRVPSDNVPRRSQDEAREISPGSISESIGLAIAGGTETFDLVAAERLEIEKRECSAAVSEQGPMASGIPPGRMSAMAQIKTDTDSVATSEPSVERLLPDVEDTSEDTSIDYRAATEPVNDDDRTMVEEVEDDDHSIHIPFDDKDDQTIQTEVPEYIPVERGAGELVNVDTDVELDPSRAVKPESLVEESPLLPPDRLNESPDRIATGQEQHRKQLRFARALTMDLKESDLEEVISDETGDAVPVVGAYVESGDVLREDELEEVSGANPVKESEPPPPPASLRSGDLPSEPNQDDQGPDDEEENLVSKPWFEEIFDADYLRTLPFLTPQATRFEANFVIESLGVGAGAKILDVGCGYGRHAMELAARGYHVVGLDGSLPLLLRGADEAQRRELEINFVHGDMRQMSFDTPFDGAYCLFSSFGYFDDETNKRTAQNIAKALKPGARFVVDVLNRDYLVTDLPSRVWWEGDGCVVLEEVRFNYFSSRIVSNRSVVFDDGRQLEQEISLRSFSLHELGKFLHAVGFRVLEISGSMSTRGRFFGTHSRDIVVVAERRLDSQFVSD